jgi:hypothetical protein
MASAPVLDDVVSGSLKDIQSSQKKNAAALESLAQSSAAHQAELKRISDQLSSLVTRMDSLQSGATPTPTFAIPVPNARAEAVAPPRRHRSRAPKNNVGVSVGDVPFSAWQSGIR